MSNDGYIDHAKLAGPQYLIYHDTDHGWRFGVSKWATLHQAIADANLFRADNLTARILKIELVEGQPVASWADESLDMVEAGRTALRQRIEHYAAEWGEEDDYDG